MAAAVPTSRHPINPGQFAKELDHVSERTGVFFSKTDKAELDTTSRFPDADLAFRLLMEAHRGLAAHASAALNARLVLLLANHIGDFEVLKQALFAARGA